MKLYKTDTKLWTVREVEGDPYPGMDSDGDPCYVNTHFETEIEAWDKLLKEAEAYIKISADTVKQLRSDILKANEQAADAVIAFDTALENEEIARKREKP